MAIRRNDRVVEFTGLFLRRSQAENEQADWLIFNDQLVFGQRQCTARIRAIIEDPDNDCTISIASLWEIGIKHALGKLELHRPIEDFFEAFTSGGFTPMPNTTPHILELAALPLHHRDPFDRMLIAQAKVEGMQLLTADPHFMQYEVALLKA